MQRHTPVWRTYSRTSTLLGTLALGLILVAATAAAPATSEVRAATDRRAPAVQETADGRQPASVRLLHAWLAAFNSGDQERLQRFLKRNWPRLVPYVYSELGLREFTGGFALRRLNSATAVRVSGWLQERDSDQFYRVVMRVSTAKRPVIVGMDLLAISRPAAFPIQRLTQAEAIAGLEARLRKRAAEHRFSGAALVAKDGEVVFAGAYGLADRDQSTANTLETRFRVASIAKMFTAVATLQLVEAGKLALDDPVGRHLRGYPNQEVATKVTVRHLLTHTGGTGDIFGPEYDLNRLQLREHSDYVKLYGSRSPAFEPGTHFEYSNYGFVLLGAIIEAVTGQSYYQYVREHVFAPARMTSTDSLPESEVPNHAIGYMRPFPGSRYWLPNTDSVVWRGNAAGDAYSTVGDLLRFADALTSNKLLTASSTQMLVTGTPVLPYPQGRPVGALPPGVRYAFGFEDARDRDGNGWVGHSGGGPGINGDLRIYLKSGYVVAVLANLDPPAAGRLSDYLDPRLPTSSSS
jgi:CubicO group peptidase (beta-lactamase class C family)